MHGIFEAVTYVLKIVFHTFLPSYIFNMSRFCFDHCQIEVCLFSSEFLSLTRDNWLLLEFRVMATDVVEPYSVTMLFNKHPTLKTLLENNQSVISELS